ncbi:MAG: DUF4388 domain-containing protein [Anaerolineae bacterium]|nr:DUF4388 domain-containing protein [Anaerolineae bacterium]
MALKGNLRDFSITQLLNLINLAQKTGALVVEGANDSAQINFREGKLAYAQLGNPSENGLGMILHKANKISEAQYGSLKERSMGMSDKELGLMLINSGYVSQKDIIFCLQSHFVEILQNLFTWAEGMFQFNAEARLPEDKIPVRLDLESIIMEGSRKLQEQERLQDEIPNLDMALKFTDRPGVNIRSVNMSVEEWRVVSYINPKNTISQIAKATKAGETGIRRIVYGLLQAGLVELVRPDGAPDHIPGIKAALPGKDRKQQKSIVDRIIRRIRSL